MNPKLAGQIRHILTSGGWLVFLLVFLPTAWWERALANIKLIGTIAGAAGGLLAIVGHYWSATSKDVPPSDIAKLPIEAWDKGSEHTANDITSKPTDPTL